MEVEINPKETTVVKQNIIDEPKGNISEQVTFENITSYLINEKNVYLQSQQRGESDFTVEEKQEIIRNIYNKGATNFLIRFGKYLKEEHLQFFAHFENDSTESYEIKHLLHNLEHRTIDRKRKRIRNRRYAALKLMIENEKYFSETEMMKRNPLLYEQLVGQYLTNDEKKERDIQVGEKTLVGILMEGIERDEAEVKRKTEEAAEVDAMEEGLSEEEFSVTENSKPKTYSRMVSEETPSCSLWGEYTHESVSSSAWGEIPLPKKKKQRTSPSFPTTGMITATERRLLKEEFVTTMYESFLDGKDEDFDYANVDENDEYDNLDLIGRDEEEKYFDSEEPEDSKMEEETETPKERQKQEDEESSEDELDIYMSALNQHPAVYQLSKGIQKL